MWEISLGQSVIKIYRMHLVHTEKLKKLQSYLIALQDVLKASALTMEDADEANKAIEAMNGAEMAGRNLKVNEARPREERPPRQDNW